MPTMRVVSDTATPYFRKVTAQMPKAIDRDSKQMAGIVRNNFRKAIQQRKLIWTRQLFDYTRVKKTKYGYGVSIPEQGLFMDRMRPHWVSTYKHPEVAKWAIDHGLVNPLTGKPPSGIYVKPHPWINAGYNTAAGQITTWMDTGYLTQLLAGGVFRG